jgi:very-short-patch-repair endonuclease
MRGQDGSVDAIVAAIAGRQHGVVNRRQLLEAGLSSSGIDRRVVAGRLHPEFRGVYRVGHRAPSILARYAAAVLACGVGAALSGLAAAHLLRLRRDAAIPEVSAPRHRSIAGVVVHRRTLPAAELGRARGIRCSSVARTLVDLAAALSLGDLARAHHEARIHHRVHPSSVEAILRRVPNAPGAANIRAVVRGDAPALLSRLERRFRGILREQRLPLPVFNRPVGAHYVDCRWREHRLTVELDSYTFHQSRWAWERDQARDRETHARGDALRRFTWADVFEDQVYMLAELNRLLSRR